MCGYKTAGVVVSVAGARKPYSHIAAAEEQAKQTDHTRHAEEQVKQIEQSFAIEALEKLICRMTAAEARGMLICRMTVVEAEEHIAEEAVEDIRLEQYRSWVAAGVAEPADKTGASGTKVAEGVVGIADTGSLGAVVGVEGAK